MFGELDPNQAVILLHEEAEPEVVALYYLWLQALYQYIDLSIHGESES